MAKNKQESLDDKQIRLHTESRENGREFTRFKRDMEELTSTIEKNQKSMSSFGGQIGYLLGFKTDNFRDSLDKLQNNINRLTTEIGAQTEEIDHLNSAYKQKLTDLEKQIEKDSEDVKLREKQKAEEEERLQKMGLSAAEIEAGLADFSKRLQEADVKLYEHQTEREEIQKKINSAEKKKAEMLEELTQKEAQMRKAVLDGMAKSAKQFSDGWNDLTNGIKGLWNTIMSMATKWISVDDKASKIARSVGMTNAERADLRATSIHNFANMHLSEKYNVVQEDFMQMNADMQNAFGRKFNMATSNYENMAAAMSLFGPEKVVGMASQLDSFGISYENSVKYTEGLMKESERTGLSFTKLSDTFLNNIKLAQTYSFKNGLRGLENMARKATELKMDMQEVAKLADKTNSIEGAVNTAAGLQVLGGPFAQFADPYALLYGGLNDLESLQDRLISLTKSLGNFNKQTGQVEMTSFDLQRVKSAASEMGMDPQKFIESINESAKREEIKKQAQAAGIKSEEELELIQNSGRLVDGVAKITDTKGNDLTISQLKNSENWQQELKKINQDQGADIKQMASSVISFNEKITGIVEDIRNQIANIVEDMGIMPKIQAWIEKAYGWLSEHVGLLITAALTYFGIRAAGSVMQIGRGLWGMGSSLVSAGKAGWQWATNIGSSIAGSSLFGGGAKVAATVGGEEVAGETLGAGAGGLGIKGYLGKMVASPWGKGIGGGALLAGSYFLNDYANNNMDHAGKMYAATKYGAVPILGGLGMASIASALGASGPVGWGIGAVAAGGLALYQHHSVEQQRKKDLQDKYGGLRGSTGWGIFGSSDYDNGDLADMMNGDIDDDLKQRMIKAGDTDILKKIEREHHKGLTSDDGGDSDDGGSGKKIDKTSVKTMNVNTLNVKRINNGVGTDDTNRYWITPSSTSSSRIRQGSNGYNSMRVSPTRHAERSSSINIPEIKVVVSGNITLSGDKKAKVLDKNAKEELTNMVKYALMNEFSKQYGFGYTARAPQSLGPSRAVVSASSN